MIDSAAIALSTCAVLHLGSASAQLSHDPDYVEGKQAWEQLRWPEASTHLSTFVARAEDRATYEVAFWLGTSWCRIPGDEAYGANILDWGLSFKQMPEAARPAFANELKSCLGWLAEAAGARRKPVVLATTGGVSQATVKATGKTYAVGGGKGSLAAYPVRMKRPIALDEFEARLVPRTGPGHALTLTSKLAPGFRLYTSKYVVLASLSPNHSDPVLREIGARLDDYVEFLGQRYALPPPDWFMTVYMFPDIPTLRTWADRLHGLDASPATLGYAFENDQSVLAMLSDQGVGTLLHELFHLMVRHSFASVPQWLDEGMASLYETSTRTEAGYFGEPNWRSAVFRELVWAMNHIHLQDVVTSPWLSDEPGIHAKLGEPVLNEEEQAYLLAYTRMFALYLQETGKLADVFKAFRERELPATYVPAKKRAVRLLEGSLGKSLTEVEGNFKEWVPAVYDPNQRLHMGDGVEKELPLIERE